ncbi:unnamed protein product [Schistosoma margrebowiei]|uniref:Uncharacterized protein n=1 Tax=Schistosoma margrebowiei TaxID=48269 RepID=A0A183N3U1_9TREM|nr:unnamed protein product [Schistosoma margrebowiei]
MYEYYDQKMILNAFLFYVVLIKVRLNNYIHLVLIVVRNNQSMF